MHTVSAPQRKWRHFPARPAAWVEWDKGRAVSVTGAACLVRPRTPVRALLEAHGRLGAPKVVYLTGPIPAGRAWLRTWADKGLPAGWESGRHWWPESGAPVLRYVHAEGATCDVHLGESWFGTGDEVTAGQGAAALATVAGMLREDMRGAPLLATPIQTGLAALDRSIPDGLDITPWPAEEQTLVRSTSGQHRMEWVGGTVEGQVVEMDMRLAYGALAWGVGAGPPVWYDHWDPTAMARWDVRFVVPADWDRPYGLLGVQDQRGVGWHWPTEGTWDTWADGSEVDLAIRAGWAVHVYAGLGPKDPKADPLGRWADRLVSMADRCQLAGDDLAYRACRAILIQGIGGLVARPQRIYITCPPGQVDDQRMIPGTLRRLGPQRVTYAVSNPPSRGDLAHPEWAARIYGRCRARLLHGPRTSGVLNLTPDISVVGFRGDALYLTADPDWLCHPRPRPGEWRPKATHTLPAVRSLREYDEATR